MDLPFILRNLPAPWRLTHPAQRSEQVERLLPGEAETAAALQALEHCIRGLSQIEPSGSTPPALESLPPELGEYWIFTLRWLAEAMPNLDDYSPARISTLLEERGFDPFREQLGEHVGRFWLASVTSDIASDILRWLKLHYSRNPTSIVARQVCQLLAVASTLIDQFLAEALLSCCAEVAWQDALTALRFVQEDLTSAPALRQSAGEFIRWIEGEMER